MISSRTVVTIALFASVVCQMGCSILHELKPHRMQRMNRGPAPSLDPEFSHWKPASPSLFAEKVSPSNRPTLSANSAEVATVRAQTPDTESR